MREIGKLVIYCRQNVLATVEVTLWKGRGLVSGWWGEVSGSHSDKPEGRCVMNH